MVNHFLQYFLYIILGGWTWLQDYTALYNIINGSEINLSKKIARKKIVELQEELLQNLNNVSSLVPVKNRSLVPHSKQTKFHFSETF